MASRCSYAFHMHEIAHGPPVLPGPLPKNAGVILEDTVPGWLLPRCTQRLPTSTYMAIWAHLSHHHRVTSEDARQLAGRREGVLCMREMSVRSDGALLNECGVWVLVRRD